jgi:prolipoprotein diacylglyceryltransferase
MCLAKAFPMPIARASGATICRCLFYPTPLYETVMGLVLFALLWGIRKKLKIPGVLFGIYLVVNGIERFFIEKIRVNTTYHIGNFHPSQAQLISALLVVAGIIIIVIRQKKSPFLPKESSRFLRRNKINSPYFNKNRRVFVDAIPYILVQSSSPVL